MPGNLFDRVCETSTTTGTGDFTLAGAVAGYRTFNSVVSSSYTFYYLIEAVNVSGVATGEWEIGIGYMSTSTVMQRQILLESSNAGATPLNFSAGTKRVYLTAPAYQLKNLVCQATLSSNLTAQNFTTATAIAWNSTGNDTIVDSGSGVLVSPHNNVTNNSRLTIPASMEQASCRLTGQVTLANITASEWVELKFRLDGGATIIGRATHATPSTGPTYQVVSDIHDLSATQYIEMLIQVQTDTSVDIQSSGSFFQLEILQ